MYLQMLDVTNAHGGQRLLVVVVVALSKQPVKITLYKILRSLDYTS